MKVLILTADSNGGYPVPASKGSAVSTLMEQLAEGNNAQRLCDMEIMSFYDEKAFEMAKQYPHITFLWVKPTALHRLLDSKERCVISVGGGLPVQPQNWPVLRQLGTVVYLEADIETLLGRLKYDTKRPKLQGGDLREKIETLMEQRKEIYEQTADLRVTTDDREFSQILQEIMEKTTNIVNCG